MIKKKKLDPKDYIAVAEISQFSDLISEGAVKAAIERRAIKTVMKYQKFGTKLEPFINKEEFFRYIKSENKIKENRKSVTDKFFADAE